MGEQIVVWLLAAGPVIGLFYLGTNFLQASGNAARATFVSVLRQGLLLIPLLYLMHALLGFTGIAAAHFVADAGSAIIAALIAWGQYRKLAD
jgi:Na+-driven multidrug efflux pump